MYLRKLDVSDAEFLCSIFADNKEYYDIFFDSETKVEKWEERIKHFLTHEEWKHYIVTNNSNQSVGWFAYEQQANIRTLIIIVIKKEYCNKGYATNVMSMFIEDCKKCGVESVELNVNEDNSRAINFYKKFGYQVYDLEVIPESNDKKDNREYKMKLEIS
ncbi:MAG: GNAT family N-acetyltransferase [Cellulosilyticaceae bacterium]